MIMQYKVMWGRDEFEAFLQEISYPLKAFANNQSKHLD